MMGAIIASQAKEVWDDSVSASLINVLRRLLQAGFAILKVHNPRQLKSTISILAQVDQVIKQLRMDTEDFSREKLTDTHFKWLEQMK